MYDILNDQVTNKPNTITTIIISTSLNIGLYCIGFRIYNNTINVEKSSWRHYQEEHFGCVIVHIHMVEFQKRGLYTCILVIME